MQGISKNLLYNKALSMLFNRKILFNFILVISILFVSGCDNAELEKENQQLKTTIIKLRNNNNGLNISLAKSELVYSQKHKKEIEAETKKIDEEKEAFRHQKEIIKKEAYENAEKTSFRKYGIISGGIVFMLFIFLYLFWKKNSQCKIDTKNKHKEINDLTKTITTLHKTITHLENNIKELEHKLKEGSKNQILSSIEEMQSKRENLQHSLDDK